MKGTEVNAFEILMIDKESQSRTEAGDSELDSEWEELGGAL